MVNQSFRGERLSSRGWGKTPSRTIRYVGNAPTRMILLALLSGGYYVGSCACISVCFNSRPWVCRSQSGLCAEQLHPGEPKSAIQPNNSAQSVGPVGAIWRVCAIGAVRTNRSVGTIGPVRAIWRIDTAGWCNTPDRGRDHASAAQARENAAEASAAPCCTASSGAAATAGHAHARVGPIDC
jgi:hypothetical protein